MAPALELSGITKSFGDFLALAAANLSVDFGEVHALLGENGARKSSLMNVAGLYSPDSGSIEVAGVPRRFLGPRESMRRGIGMIHQNFKLVKRFTVAENVLLAKSARQFQRRQSRHRARDQGKSSSTRLCARSRPPCRQPVNRRTAAGRDHQGFGGRRPHPILDEPTAVLTEGEAQRLLAMVRDIAEQGAAVILVTHKLRDVRTFAHRVTIMRGGKTVGTVDPRQTTAEELTRLMVGSNVVDPSRSAKSPGEVRLRVTGLASATVEGHTPLVDASFSVRSGEIYGIAGVGGNGQTELAEALVGGRKPSGGTITIQEPGLSAPAAITAATPRQRRRHGVASIPADRQSFGLATRLSIVDNFAIGFIHEGRFGSVALIDRAGMRRATEAAVRDFEVQGVRSPWQRSGTLSGGNAQKLILARELSRTPSNYCRP